MVQIVWFHVVETFKLWSLHHATLGFKKKWVVKLGAIATITGERTINTKHN